MSVAACLNTCEKQQGGFGTRYAPAKGTKAQKSEKGGGVGRMACSVASSVLCNGQAVGIYREMTRPLWR